MKRIVLNGAKKNTANTRAGQYILREIIEAGQDNALLKRFHDHKITQL